MELTKNFDYEEFFVSEDHPDYAQLLKEKHLDDKEMQDKFFKLATFLLQPLRDHINKPMAILSAYRDEWLNTKVGGVGDSDHLFALACDITFIGIGYKHFEWCALNLPYRQCIWYPEQSFIHLSINDPCKPIKHEAMIKENGEYHKAILTVA